MVKGWCQGGKSGTGKSYTDICVCGSSQTSVCVVKAMYGSSLSVVDLLSYMF